jgi:hypothetical protein
MPTLKCVFIFIPMLVTVCCEHATTTMTLFNARSMYVAIYFNICLHRYEIVMNLSTYWPCRLVLQMDTISEFSCWEQLLKNGIIFYR